MKSGWFKKRSATERAAIIAGILGIIGTVLAVVISNVLQPPTVIVQPPTEPTAQPPTESELHLVDVGFIESDEFPKLDIKLRNTGEKVAFLKEVVFKVEERWKVTYPYPSPAVPVPVSEYYDVELLISETTPYLISMPVSQSIEPNKVDRFAVTLGNDAATGTDGYVFLMTVELVYDEDDKTVTSQKLVFEQMDATEIFRKVASDEGLPEDQLKYYRRIAKEIDMIDGIKSERLNEALRVILETSIED